MNGKRKSVPIVCSPSTLVRKLAFRLAVSFRAGTEEAGSYDAHLTRGNEFHRVECRLIVDGRRRRGGVAVHSPSPADRTYLPRAE